MNCSICNQDHSHQIVDYPLGSTVEALHDFTGAIDATKANSLEGYFPRITIPAGSLGTVVYHHDDGRAVIEFDAEKGLSPCGHTFHYPESYFKPGLRPEPKKLTAEEAAVAYSRFMSGPIAAD